MHEVASTVKTYIEMEKRKETNLKKRAKTRVGTSPKFSSPSRAESKIFESEPSRA